MEEPRTYSKLEYESLQSELKFYKKLYYREREQRLRTANHLRELRYKLKKFKKLFKELF